MKLGDTRESYSYHTGKTSDIVRQLGLAGIAIVWVFKVEVGGRPIVPSELVLAAGLILIALGMDLLHYVTGSLVWGIFNRYKENKNIGQDEEFVAPKQLNWPTIALFWLKTGFLIGAYALIIHFLYRQLI